MRNLCLNPGCVEARCFGGFRQWRITLRSFSVGWYFLWRYHGLSPWGSILGSQALSREWRPDQYCLLRTPERRVLRRMGNRPCGGTRSFSRCFTSAARLAKVPPCLRRSGFAQAGTGFLRRPHWPGRLSREVGFPPRPAPAPS